MVKVLMAHGFGTNAAIFEAQTAPLRALLPPHWEYHFLDGPLECEPAPGIGEIYPEQTYLCYYDIPTLVEFQSAHDFLEEVIDQEGPFDIAWGFSGGGMIICSLLLRYAHETPHLPLPFRCAIFMNCPMPWSATPDLGRDVTPLVLQHHVVSGTLAETDRLLALAYEKHPVNKEDMLQEAKQQDVDVGWSHEDLLLQPGVRKHASAKKPSAPEAESKKEETHRTYSDYISHRIFPEVDKVRIHIPTGHIIGERDPVKDSSVMMRDMCDARVMLTYKHGFGHEIPVRSRTDLNRIKEVIEKTVTKSEFV